MALDVRPLTPKLPGMTKPILFILRRDLRLSDHPGLTAAAQTGRPVIPVFIDDEVLRAQGAAPRWRLGQAVSAFSEALKDIGSQLILRRGDALDELRKLITETGADTVWWSRAYDPPSVARDTGVKAALERDGIDARSHPGHLLFEPWSVKTGQGGPYRVYSPYWKAVRGRDVGPPAPRVEALAAPDDWPDSLAPDDLNMGAAMRRGASVVARFACVGERAALDRLHGFAADKMARYKDLRDFPGADVTSGLSENLTCGEVSPRTCWLVGQRALDEGNPGAGKFLSELVWREFAYHLMWHFPAIAAQNWRDQWDRFPWRDASEDSARWQQGRTGVPFVDAAMRQMYVTGTMHNRARMIVASYLTKHLMTHWKIGLDWFADCLTDWDPAANAMGWQWVAGSGPDAAPFFRIFNPETQAGKFDRKNLYQDRWIAETQGTPRADALAYFEAIPERWNLSPDDAYPEPAITLAEGRTRALEAYQVLRG